jgi:hypothetical protein
VQEAVLGHADVVEERLGAVAFGDRDHAGEAVLGAEGGPALSPRSGHVGSSHRVAAGHEEIERLVEDGEDLDLIHFGKRQRRRHRLALLIVHGGFSAQG